MNIFSMRHLRLRAFCCAIVTLLVSPLAAVRADQTHPVLVDVTAGHVLNRFSPVRTIGAGVDSQNLGAVANIYTPKNVSAMLSAGLGPASYRLYTELSVQDWHWNPQGTWSDPARQGYWTGAAAPSRAIIDTFGYRLPHRGFTNDQGNDDDYSRLDDGDTASYWKSNPYLTSRFTGEPDAAHPQWVVVALAAPAPLSAIRVDWASPYAANYVVQYWD
ncbi:MAG: glycosyl hydrolase family 5, partial [Candidatus Eremiobacteraeota bacterium]|nr:glycosyl hydrolase family 5 [Candidatus Eremiobacteraeota bacterium]